MVSVKITGIGSVRQEISSGYKKLLTSIAADLTKELKAHTPVNTGRARKGWDTKMKDDGFVTENKVPYVGYLDKPYTKSKQAPRGMVGPSLDKIKGKYK